MVPPQGAIITKDNLVKLNSQGSKKYVFCHHDETIKHLFFSFAGSIWSVIQVALNLYPPSSVANTFGNWLHGINVKFRNSS